MENLIEDGILKNWNFRKLFENGILEIKFGKFRKLFENCILKIEF